MKGWIGVDLDGTLALYDEWRGHDHIGEPIELMLNRVKGWLDDGVYDVRIFTARICPATMSLDKDKDVLKIESTIKSWSKKHIGRELEVTCMKDFAMVELWDDRAIRIEHNTGKII